MTALTADLEAPCPPAALFGWVDDLARYPVWLDLVREARPLGADRWEVTLTASLGPLRRSKRLRMTRTELEPGTRARFERREDDGREHASWVLEARVEDHPAGSRLTMDLRYDGRFWGPVLERVLRDEINRARPRLAALVGAP